MYTIYGRVKHQDAEGNCLGFVSGGWVQPYFKKIDEDSNESKWSTEPYELDPINDGYFSFDIEDYDLLGPEGIYRKGKDKFYLAFYWDENDNANKDRNSTTITHAAFIEHTLKSGEDDYELNLTLIPVKGPVLSSVTFPTGKLTTQTQLVMSESSSVDAISVVTDGCGDEYSQTVSQLRNFDGEIIFDGYKASKTEYYWDEVADPTITEASSTSSHTYTDAGEKTVEIKVYSAWGGVSSAKRSLLVAWNTPNINFSPSKTTLVGSEELTLTNTTTDIDSRSNQYRYEWIILDKNVDNSEKIETFYDKDFDFVPTYTFITPGEKTIKLRCYWNNGFENLIDEAIKTVNVESYEILADFSWDKIVSNRSEDVTFSATLSGGVDNIVSVEWIIPDNWPASDEHSYTFADNEESIFNQGSPDNTSRIDNTYTLSGREVTVKLHSNELRNIICNVTYFNGWSNDVIKVEKTYQPETTELNSSFTTSNTTPVGRKEVVTFVNSTDKTENQYKITFDVSDFYSELNIDNPIPGTQTDNSKTYESSVVLDEFSHAFQNTAENTITLNIQYDNGWQRVETSNSKKISPKTIQLPEVEFTWTPENPASRQIDITLQDITVDPDNIINDISYTINDKFDTFNPNNPNYGISESTNNFVIYGASGQFKSQTISDTLVTATYQIDNGFEYVNVNKEHLIEKDELSFDLNLEVNEIDTLGKEIVCKNTSLGDATQINAIWTFVDRNGLDNDSETSTTVTEQYDTEISFTWNSPSRRPFTTSSNPAQESRENKTIDLEIQYDNGWSDNNFESDSLDVEARTNEVGELSIDFDETTKYGKETISFSMTTQNESWIVPNTVYWEIIDEDLNGNDTSLTIDEVDSSYIAQKIFESSGSKQIITGLYFDDGYGRRYVKETSARYHIHAYSEPDINFSWTPEKPISNQMITLTFDYDDSSPKGEVKKLFIDYNDDGEFDSFITSESEGIETEVYEAVRPDQIKFKYIRTDEITTFRVKVEWFDGWQLYSKEVSKELTSEIVPPIVSLSIKQVYCNNYMFEIDATDPDGTIKDYKFEVFFKNPVVEITECRNPNDKKANKALPVCETEELFGNYIKVYDSDWIDEETIWRRLSSNGHYKVIGWARDLDELSSSDTKEIYIEADFGEPSEPGECIVCTKRCIGGVMKVYPFSVSIVGKD